MDKFAEIEAFVAVVDHGGFSAAAERLRIAKSAVSRRVNQLEERLGTRLINRTTRKISLTESGRDFHAQASQILDDIVEAEQSVTDHHVHLKGTIRLSAPLSFGVSYLTTALSLFLQQHPDIQLEVDFDDRQIDLVKEGFDMTVRATEMADSTLIARRITCVRMLTCASDAYLQQHPPPKHPAELNAHTGLEYSLLPRRRGWQYIDPAGQPVFAEPRVCVRCNNGDSLVTMAQAGLGVVHQPTFILREAIMSGSLRVLLPEWEDSGFFMYAVFPPGKNQPRRVRALTDFLIAQFGDEPPWDKDLSEWLRPGP